MVPATAGPGPLRSAPPVFWVGSYTSDMDGGGEGISAVAITPEGEPAVMGTCADVPSPSFLAVHPTWPVLYAVSEAAGKLYCLRREGPAGLSLLGDAGPTGSCPCHVAIGPDGAWVVVSCWGDGAVVAFELGPDGALGGRAEAEPAADPHRAGRRSRAHASLVLDDGLVMTTDIGYDLVRLWAHRAGRGLSPAYSVVLPEGCGPRHLVQALDGTVYVVTEYSIEVVVLRRGADGRFGVTDVVPATADGAQAGDAGAGIALGPDMDRLYVGVRGSDRISTLALDGQGGPVAMADVACGGRWPRHHLVHGGRLYVALQHSDEIAVFMLEESSGLPVGPVRRLATGSPAVIVAA